MRFCFLFITVVFCMPVPAQDTVATDMAYYRNKRLEAIADLDTTGLEHFWRTFQTAVKEDRRPVVVRMLDFPIHETLVHAWRFSVDCDTAYFAHHLEEYLDTDITSQNAMARYDFLFTQELKAMIARTDVHRILREGHSHVATAITYHFWAEHYGYGCGSDTSLHFHFHRAASGWLLSIARVG